MKRADKEKLGKAEYVCSYCGKDQGSKFNLKVHKSHCANGLSTRVQNASRHQPQSWHVNMDRVILASRETKYHKFVSGAPRGGMKEPIR